VLSSESIVIIRIKGEHLLYNKISGENDRLWMGECLLCSNFFPRGSIYNIVNYPGEGLLYSKYSEGSKHSGGRFTIRHRNQTFLF